MFWGETQTGIMQGYIRSMKCTRIVSYYWHVTRKDKAQRLDAVYCGGLKQMLRLRTELFWIIMQRVVVMSYRRFGTTYRSHLQGVKNKKNGTDSLSRKVDKKLPPLAV